MEYLYEEGESVALRNDSTPEWTQWRGVLKDMDRRFGFYISSYFTVTVRVSFRLLHPQPTTTLLK